ncbi:AMP-binding protein [Halobacterium salinarum]|uniref:AMP-binding protein n=1 Tax=Halobacterium salinarum TaxID=2242 RepID=UPI00255346EE|nr:AMP-binding protein [Halobacterium salinarum]MDL0129022.1 AMP-binding protein [Halobacterium salinarum]
MHRPLLVTDFIDRARTYYGDETAVVATTGRRYTYSELADRADRFSAVFQAAGIDSGDRVAVLDPNTHYHLEAAYGAMQLGAIHTPLNYRLTPDDYAYILADAGADAIYADAAYADRVEAVRDRIPTTTFITDDPAAVDGDWQDADALLADADPDDYDRPDMAEDDVITINYTSGTTGDPKGVCRTHRNEVVHALLLSTHHTITDTDTYLWTLPMFHANGWGHIFAITGAGATHVCTRGVDAASVFDTIQAEAVSYLCAAPTVLNMLLDYHEAHDVAATGDADVRVATAGSAPPEATIRAVESALDWSLMHVYGATETGPLIATSDADRLLAAGGGSRAAMQKRQGIGLLGTELRVVDEHGNDVPRDNETIGEIVVSGNQVMDRYWNKPDATERAFTDRVDGYFHMGDFAVVDDTGFVSILDRKKDIIISGGENISSIELEDTLFEHDAVGEVAVVPSPHDDWGETPKAFVVPASGDPNNPGVTTTALVEYTRAELASFKTVRRVEFVDELPTTATGKVQKYELRAAEFADEESLVGQG